MFIVGMNGSGTSMLADSLGFHPCLYVLPRETRILPDLINRIDGFGDLRIDANFWRLWSEVRGIVALRRANKGRELPIPGNWKEFPRSLASVVDANFRYLAAQDNAERWGEKTPQYVQHLAALQRLFPHAKFIHILRDGRDCAASFYRRWARTPELTIYRWKKVVVEGRAQGKALDDAYIEVTYEELTRNPSEVMKRVCKFLDLKFDPRVVLSHRPQTKDGSSRLGKIEATKPRWPECFNEAMIARLEGIGGTQLEELGYATRYGAHDQDPAWWRLAYWRYRDLLRELRRTVGRRHKHGFKAKWSQVRASVRVAIRQMRANKY